MAYKVIILYQLYMPSYFLGTFTEYPYWKKQKRSEDFFRNFMFYQIRVYGNIQKNENNNNRKRGIHEIL